MSATKKASRKGETRALRLLFLPALIQLGTAAMGGLVKSNAFGLGGGISAGNAFGSSRSSSSGSSGPTHMNLTITMDGKKITEAVGVRIAKEIRIQGGVRSR